MNRRVFHQAVRRTMGKSPTRQRRTVWWWLTRIPVMLLRIIVMPFRAYASVRRSMTPASVTLLLISIVSLNIIWGYPWSGMFAACISLMVIGGITNRLMRPNLQIGFSLPRSSPAGQPFVVTTHARNQGWLPAMDLSIGFAKPKQRPRGKRDGFSLREPHSIALLQVGHRVHRSGSIRFDRRGVQPLPDLIVTSMFPFHLFRSSQRYESGTSIAVTPELLTGEEDDLARTLLDALGSWSHRLLSGDALDYTGSREYEVGMPVRRWDFSSWARLGRPIVREFQSPTIQMVTLIVDTSIDPGGDKKQIERVLSLAATAVTELTRKNVRVGMFVTHSETSEPSGADSGLSPADPGMSAGDCESLLIRMAEAEVVDTKTSDRQIQRVAEQMRHMPLLVLTARGDVHLDVRAASLSVLRVDPPELTGPRQSRHEVRESDVSPSLIGAAMEGAS